MHKIRLDAFGEILFHAAASIFCRGLFDPICPRILEGLPLIRSDIALPDQALSSSEIILPSNKADLQKDELFAQPVDQIADFHFGKQTAQVFDDMLDRSVPYYSEIQRATAELARDFAAEGTNIYDLGCSTCNSFLQIREGLSEDLNVKFIGIDSSAEMLERARAKLAKAQFAWEYELRKDELNACTPIENASVVLMVLTLQFVRPLYREKILKTIYEGLNPGGCLILVEKVLGEHSVFNRLFINHYYEMKKRHGYTEMEIAQKREALENVLVPYQLEENKELLRYTGFEKLDVFFKWYNFCGIIAQK